jgi:membrane protein YdbS with pleckstrin-like domain
MITDKEKKFIQYWEAERSYRATFQNKLVSGLPMALLFCMPIILSLVSVYFFFPEWYTKVSKMTGGTFVVILVAMIIAAVFIAYFRMHYKWEMNEQLYKELKQKLKREAAKE